MDKITFKENFTCVLEEAIDTYSKCPGALLYSNQIFDSVDDVNTENECRKSNNLEPCDAFWSISLKEDANPYSEINIALVGDILEIDFTYIRYENKKKVALVDREKSDKKILIHLDDFKIKDDSEMHPTVLLIINRILRFHREFMCAMQYNDYELWTNVNPIL